MGNFPQKKQQHRFWANFRFGPVSGHGQWTAPITPCSHHNQTTTIKRQPLQTLQYTAVQTTSRTSSGQEPSDFLTPLIMHKIRVASYVSIIARHIHNGDRKWKDGLMEGSTQLALICSVICSFI